MFLDSIRISILYELYKLYIYTKYAQFQELLFLIKCQMQPLNIFLFCSNCPL